MTFKNWMVTKNLSFINKIFKLNSKKNSLIKSHLTLALLIIFDLIYDLIYI